MFRKKSLNKFFLTADIPKLLVVIQVPECNWMSRISSDTPVIPMEKTKGHSITELAQTVNKGQKYLPRKHFLHAVASALMLRVDLDNTFKI